MLERVTYPDRRIITERPFPTDPLARQGVLLTSFNTAPKTALFLLTPSYTGITERELNAQYYEISKDTPMEDRYPVSNTRGIRTLVNNGLVYEYFNPEIRRLVSKTRAGIDYGILTAALVLDFEMRNKISLRDVLGKTGGTQTDINTQLMRAQILTFLRNQTGPVRRVDIAMALGADPGRVGDVLKELSDHRAVTYDFAAKDGSSVVTFGVNADFGGDPLTLITGEAKSEVVQICLDLISSQILVTEEGIRERLPEDFLIGWGSEHALRNFILLTLSTMVKGGFLYRTKFIGSEKYSEARITRKGEKVVDQFLVPLVGIASDDPKTVNHVEGSIVPVVRDSLRQHIRNSIELYYPHSSSFSDKAEDENYRNVLSVIRLNPEGISTEEIARILGLNSSTVNGYLINLRISYPLEEETRGKVVFYSFELSLEEVLPTTDPEVYGIIKKLDTNERIPLASKRKLLVYRMWVEFGSVEEVASRLNNAEGEVVKTLREVDESDQLIDFYSTIDSG